MPHERFECGLSAVVFGSFGALFQYCPSIISASATLLGTSASQAALQPAGLVAGACTQPRTFPPSRSMNARMRPAVMAKRLSFVVVPGSEAVSQQLSSATGPPPKSVSLRPQVKPPLFFTQLLNGTHRPAFGPLDAHALEAQSPWSLHVLSTAQRGAFVGAPPPQSTSVSVPFLIPSLFVGGWQTPPVHATLLQSLVTAQLLPVSQRGAFVGAPPPQSTSVSVPFLIPSLFVGGWQTPPVHATLLQSLVTAQLLPVSQRGAFVGAPPPQSTSVSRAVLDPVTSSSAAGRHHRCTRRCCSRSSPRSSCRSRNVERSSVRRLRSRRRFPYRS